MRSRLVAVAIVWGCTGGGAVAACGSDEPSSSSGDVTPDAAVPDAVPPTDGGVTTSIVAPDVVVYTGMTARLDASKTAAQSFAWVVKSAPPGSAVMGAPLTGANTATPVFRTDVSGGYVLTVTATIGGAPSTKDVKVTAVAAPLFYMQTSFTEDPAYFEYRTIGTDGTGGHPIDCRTNGRADASADDRGELMQYSMFLADMGEDWWEAPPGGPSRVAFAQFEANDGGQNQRTLLGLGTNASTCQNPPVRVRSVPEDGGTEGFGLLQPRFSKTGARVAYLEERASGWYLASVGYDGSDRRDLATMCSPEQSTSDCFKPAVFPQRPQWLNDQTVGWVRNRDADAGTGWEVMVANDSANPQPRAHMTCDGVAPRSFAFLADGTVIANREAPDADREDLWVLKPSTPGGQCQVVRNLTNLPTPRSYARDFSVSPDEQQVAFVRREEPDSGPADGGGLRFGGQVYAASLTAAGAPTPVTGTPQEALFGPRYVAGASQIAWNGLVYDGGPQDAGVDGAAPAIAVAPVTGGAPRYVVVSDLDAGTYMIGGGNGGACDFSLKCSASRAPSGSLPGVASFAAVAGVLALRRRRRARSNTQT